MSRGEKVGGDTPEGIARGVTKIVETLRAKLPVTKILLIAVFPRGEKPGTTIREKIANINKTIAKLDDGGKTVKYLDIGAKFLAEDKSISKDIMPDFLHLTEAGYKLWADAVLPTVKELLAAK